MFSDSLVNVGRGRSSTVLILTNLSKGVSMARIVRVSLFEKGLEGRRLLHGDNLSIITCQLLLLRESYALMVLDDHLLEAVGVDALPLGVAEDSLALSKELLGQALSASLLDKGLLDAVAAALDLFITELVMSEGFVA